MFESGNSNQTSKITEHGLIRFKSGLLKFMIPAIHRSVIGLNFDSACEISGLTKGANFMEGFWASVIPDWTSQPDENMDGFSS